MPDRFSANFTYARPTISVVRVYSRLMAQHRLGLVPHMLYGNTEKGYGDLLTRSKQHVLFPGVRLLSHLLG